jgi:hypothetical protein
MYRYTLLLLVSISLLFSSCNKDLGKAFDSLKSKCSASDDPAVQVIPATKCRSWYPMAEKDVKTITKYIPGKKVKVPGDTQYVPVMVDCDELKKKGESKHVIRVPVPVYERVDTMSLIREATFKDMQEIEYWNKQSEIEAKQKNKALQSLAEEKSLREADQKVGRGYKLKFYGLLSLLLLIVVVYVGLKKFF